MTKKNMANQHQSLLAKYLTEEIRKQLEDKKTKTGFVLDDVIRSGIENPDSGVGIYAPDAETYDVFSSLFDPVIQDYHGFGSDDSHKQNLDPSHLSIDELDPKGNYIVSTRVRVGRNLNDFPFAPGISKLERDEVEKLVVDSLSDLEGDLSGSYHSLSGMDEEVRQQLVTDHFLFKEGDRFLGSAGANRDWPTGRGIFHSDDKRFLVWVNEEDQIRIISMEQGGDLYSVFERLSRAVKALEKKLTFAYSDKFGYLSSCPTNVGTAMRASFHVRLPKLGKDEDKLKAIASDFGLSVRGIHGEHSSSEGGVYDISNKRRLGISEVEAVQMLYEGTKKLIEIERSL